MIDKRSLRVGKEVVVQITGVVGEFNAVVTGHDPREKMGIVEVVSEGMWKGTKLKRDDYIVIEQ
jgi:hypothetical protein